MSALTTLPFAKMPGGYDKHLNERPSKPSKNLSRSMTHPHRDPAKPSNGRHRLKNGDPFDPEELTRRLTAYVTEQKLVAQRRREARAAKERAAAIRAGLDPHDVVYHHVPTVAASAFHRTATPNIVTAETVHKLSAPILKAALNNSNPDDAHDDPRSTPARKKSTQISPLTLQQTILQDQAELDRERLRNRNQFQLTHALEEAAEVDELRDVYRLPQRTFGEFAHLRSGAGAGGRAHARPLSTGDVFPDPEDADVNATPASLPRVKTLRVAPSYDGRNDWAQEEEKSPSEKGGRGVRERVSGPFMRRKESVWVLMGKKEKEKEKKIDDEGTGVGRRESSSPPLDGKRGFLARFKRQPS